MICEWAFDIRRTEQQIPYDIELCSAEFEECYGGYQQVLESQNEVMKRTAPGKQN